MSDYLLGPAGRSGVVQRSRSNQRKPRELYAAMDWLQARQGEIERKLAEQHLKAEQKADTRRTKDGLPVHSFQTLLADLATITKNRIQPKLQGTAPFDQITRPTALQRHAFKLLGVKVE